MSVPATSAIPPQPVVPVEAEADSPAKALDPIAAGPSLLDRARDLAKPYMDAVDQTARPYVEKVASTTRPYTDPAVLKAQEFVKKMEGVPVAGSQGMPSNPAHPIEKSLVSNPPDGASVPTSASASATGDSGAQAKGMFDQVTSAVSSTFTQITHTIEERTTGSSQTGIISQVTNAVQKGVEKVDAFMDQTAANGIGGAGVAVTAPAVQTTTNTSPHPTQPL